MAHTFTFAVHCTVERISGKFASRDDIAEAIQQEIENIQPDVSGLDVDGVSEYDFSFDGVEEVPPKSTVMSEVEKVDPEPDDDDA